jgi:uncharacterized phage-associated protein
MASAHDVAAYILEKTGATSAMKLQKLVYYSQAWHLVWDDEPLFGDRVEAWANGPVVPVLYRAHRGSFTVKAWSQGQASKLTTSQRQSIDAIVKHYGPKEAVVLSQLTHREAPWRDAREGLQPGARSDREITKAAMAEYYGSLV